MLISEWGPKREKRGQPNKGIDMNWEKLVHFYLFRLSSKSFSFSKPFLTFSNALMPGVGVPILYQYSSKRLLHTAINGTCKNTIGGTQWENF